ncbi:patatin-like phospholipase family protein [Pseudoxanthomonas wuyuanensis]|uniref:Predicted acylesterase/phospholipase RssA, contains patatin domain n=1 Tax=Pseudoxanthomonas wuyuanensis TaxID=1073196 RepID=A0A286CZX6_9GAMM|nr:patatin-like phospholipase family protein [Pseudoxanthomonas wuyuanensis]KAF1722404.1 lectin subunit beta [Pseudoxanthomonas wuyuanensis]SOD51916.1 Predicted acylesterase/phospholipase RssA, contains patatin domain [Pseudoxanthomonas wuyuanensis]
MLSIHSARKRGSGGRIGLAVAGGGPIGGMYELGALRAMDEALDGLDPTRLDCYVGVSSGAFLAAGLANRMDTAEICRIFITGTSDDAQFRPETFLRPNLDEYLQRAATLPGLYADWLRRLLRDPRKATRWSDLLLRFGGLVPTGLFDNTGVESFLRDIFSRRGRSNDFRKLDADLFVVAVDLDSGEAVRFGEPGWDEVPISQAVQASSALPGLYSPVEINGRHFLDGALRRTMHGSTVLDRGIDLMIGINPLVPFDATHAAPRAGEAEQIRLTSGGLPAVLSQTLRTLLQSRMQIGMEKYPRQYPNIDQLLFEPNAHDSELFFTNLFSFSSRHRVCQLAYRNTLDDLRKRADVLRPMLAAHGIGLREDIINDRQRSILDGLGRPPRMTETTARLRRALDDVDNLLAQRRAPKARQQRHA